MGFYIGNARQKLESASLRRLKARTRDWVTVLGSLLVVLPCHAAGGRILATGGVTQLEGAAGGGLVPWALITGYGTRDEVGGSGFVTYVETGDFNLRAAGGALGLYDRLELSYTRQHFDLGDTVPGESIEQDVVGAKLKIVGDGVFDQDRWWPQLAVGLQYKKNHDFGFVPRLLGAQNDTGVDFYFAATKLYLAGFLGRNVLVNTTVRATKANQFGLLGFGGDRNNRYRPEFEGSAAVFLNDQLAIGAEFRTRPDNLRAFEENDIHDVFLAYVPNKHCALTLAYSDLGRIADKNDQDALYLSALISF